MNKLPKEMNDQLFQKQKGTIIELQRMIAEECLVYEMSGAAKRDISACMTDSYREGKAEGMEEGILAGIRQVASNMKHKGIDLASIVDCTGLSADVILAL